jgi:hypothetical protein
MSFTPFVNSTTAYAEELNENWRHIAHGGIHARLPRDGASLTAADATYDLGSSTATWKSLFCNTLHIHRPLAPASTASAVTVPRLGYSWNLIDELYNNSYTAPTSPFLARTYNLTGEPEQILINAYVDRTTGVSYGNPGYMQCLLYLADTSGTYLSTGGSQELNYLNSALGANRRAYVSYNIMQEINPTIGSAGPGFLQGYAQTLINLKAGMPRMGFTRYSLFDKGVLFKYYDIRFSYVNQATIGSIYMEVGGNHFRNVHYQLWMR